jgi:gas vesicle protein
MAENSGMVKGFIVGLLAGGAVGAVLALLYAPKSGRELRKDLSQGAEELLDEAEGAVSAARSRASEIVSDARQRSDQLISDARKRASSLLEDAEKVISGVRQQAGTGESGSVADAVKAGVDAFKAERGRS